MSSKADQMCLLVPVLSLSLITSVCTRSVSSSLICTRDSNYLPSPYPILSLLSGAAGLASSNTWHMCRASPCLWDVLRSSFQQAVSTPGPLQHKELHLIKAAVFHQLLRGDAGNPAGSRELNSGLSSLTDHGDYPYSFNCECGGILKKGV